MTSPLIGFLRERREKLASCLAEQSIVEAVLITGPANVRWLTGLPSSNAAVLALPDRLVVFTDARYVEQARGFDPEIEVVVARGVAAQGLEFAASAGVHTVGVESAHLSVEHYGSLMRQAEGLGVAITQVGEWVESLRVRKDSFEISALRRACEISTVALAALIDDFAIGDTEIVVARRLESLFGELGADDRAFPSIVAAGPHSAIPHHAPTSRPIQFGDVLKVDFGAQVDGYHADCTRTFVVGAEPTSLMQDSYAAVSMAAAAARECLEPGIQVAELDRVARSVLSDAKLDDKFTHGLGHGVGLEIHEAPLLAKDIVGTIVDGAVVTIEPGVYLPGVFGFRIEDTCHVTSVGTTILTDFPRELLRIA